MEIQRRTGKAINVLLLQILGKLLFLDYNFQDLTSLVRLEVMWAGGFWELIKTLHLLLAAFLLTPLKVSRGRSAYTFAGAMVIY